VPDQEPFADKGDQLAGRGEEVVDEVGGHEDLESEGEDQQAKGSGEGIVEKAKEKGKELLDKISGPDVPPSLVDEEEKGSSAEAQGARSSTGPADRTTGRAMGDEYVQADASAEEAEGSGTAEQRIEEAKQKARELQPEDNG
jgi:uncharacterized protein YjbJ (UPF0337 family)